MSKNSEPLQHVVLHTHDADGTKREVPGIMLGDVALFSDLSEARQLLTAMEKRHSPNKFGVFTLIPR